MLVPEYTVTTYTCLPDEQTNKSVANSSKPAQCIGAKIGNLPWFTKVFVQALIVCEQTMESLSFVQIGVIYTCICIVRFPATRLI
jgi:hypothetical protein